MKINLGVCAPKVCVEAVFGNINGYRPPSSNHCLASCGSWNYFEKYWAIPFLEFGSLCPSLPSALDWYGILSLYRIQKFHCHTLNPNPRLKEQGGSLDIQGNFPYFFCSFSFHDVYHDLPRASELGKRCLCVCASVLGT